MTTAVLPSCPFSSTCVTPGNSRRTHPEWEPCIYMHREYCCRCCCCCFVPGMLLYCSAAATPSCCRSSCAGWRIFFAGSLNLICFVSLHSHAFMYPLAVLCRIYGLDLPTSSVIADMRGAKAGVGPPRRSPACISIYTRFPFGMWVM